MLWLSAGDFGDEGTHARNQLEATLEGSWRLGFETNNVDTFAKMLPELGSRKWLEDCNFETQEMLREIFRGSLISSFQD